MEQSGQIRFLERAENPVINGIIQIYILPRFAVSQLYAVRAGLGKSQYLFVKPLGITSEFLNLKSRIAVYGELAGHECFQQQGLRIGNAGGFSMPDAEKVHAVQTRSAQIVPAIAQVAIYSTTAVGMHMGIPNSLIMSHKTDSFFQCILC